MSLENVSSCVVGLTRHEYHEIVNRPCMRLCSRITLSTAPPSFPVQLVKASMMHYTFNACTKKKETKRKETIAELIYNHGITCNAMLAFHLIERNISSLKCNRFYFSIDPTARNFISSINNRSNRASFRVFFQSRLLFF